MLQTDKILMPLAKMNQTSQCVLSTTNLIFSNFVQIQSVNSLFVNM